jgi:hypothetical protein
LIAYRNSMTVTVESATGAAVSEDAPDPFAEHEVDLSSTAR